MPSPPHTPPSPFQEGLRGLQLFLSSLRRTPQEQLSGCRERGPSKGARSRMLGAKKCKQALHFSAIFSPLELELKWSLPLLLSALPATTHPPLSRRPPHMRAPKTPCTLTMGCKQASGRRWAEGNGGIHIWAHQADPKLPLIESVNEKMKPDSGKTWGQ
ncbi:unnamed protein product [Pleuronectes platessa]|uniref:Uncharacterized protein n=1 Tax=Pleuronectes platessa TaxID=8262 RepID=A0A9N7YJF1_PLEPL|nr:unnamed protein product [Pleuronectes platessa]